MREIEWPDDPPFSPDDFRRYDESPDAFFYDQPRFVTHIDDAAIAAVTDFYAAKVLPPSGTPGAAVLDLCSSWISHYPKGYTASRVAGLGMNAEEMKRNAQLTEFVVQDLNQSPRLPFGDAEFDAVTCTVSFDYLTRPFEVMAELHRVLRPGASVGVYDIMQIKAGELTFPVPWATESHISKVATPETYEDAIHQAGFEIGAKTVRLDYALEFFEQIRAKTASNGGPPPFGLHLLMQESTPLKVKNMIDNFADGLIAPVEIIVRK